MMPCHIVGLNHNINISADNTIEVMVFAMVSLFANQISIALDLFSVCSA